MNDNLNFLSNNRFFIWYVAVLFAIYVFIYIFTKDITLPLIITGIGFIGSFVFLLCSIIIAKYVHKIKTISPEMGGDKEKLYNLVEELAIKANLPKTPEVGIYDSPDCNAFSTGFNKSHSLIAFSNSLLKTLSFEEIRAVAAHEIAHIANRDMLGTVIIEGTVRSSYYFIKLVFFVCGLLFIFARYSSKTADESVASTLGEILSNWVGLIISVIIMFLGKLVSLFYSRHREYKADTGAALLTSPDAMISALRKLAQDENEIPKNQAAFSCFKIMDQPSFLEILSTHPTIEKRIEALKSLNDTPTNIEDTAAN